MKTIFCNLPPAFLLAVLLAPAALADDTTARVQAEGESAVSYEDALNSALRSAVREVAGVVLAAETKVADFVLIRDSIYSRSAGYVRSYRELNRSRGLDGTFRVKISAEVARGSITDDSLAIRNLIEHVGRPQFTVSVDEREGSEHGVGAWVEGAFSDHLRQSGLSVLHRQTADAALQRQYERAAAAGNTRRAAQLKWQMGAPYGVHVVAFGTTRKETIYNVETNAAAVEVQVTVSHRDTGAVVASHHEAGRAASVDTAGMRSAAADAVARAFPAVLDKILSHWTEELDVGARLAVRLFDTPYEDVAALSAKLRTVQDVSNVEIIEAPEGGIASISVIGRIIAEDLASALPRLMGGGYKAAIEGPRLVTVEPR